MPSSETTSKTPPQPNSVDDHHGHSHLPNAHNIIHLIDEYAHHFAYGRQRTLYPRFDVEEGATVYELFGEIPGCKKEDIHLHEVDGFGIKIEGIISRIQSINNSGHLEHVTLEPRYADEVPKLENNGNADLNITKPDTTSWPDMAEPGMEAAFAAKEENARPGAKADEISAKPIEDSAKLAAPTGAKTGVVKGTAQTYPKVLFHERLVGNFQRTIRFPGPIDTQKVVAELKSGILYIRIPKDLQKEAEIEKERKRIDIAWAEAHMWGL